MQPMSSLSSRLLLLTVLACAPAACGPDAPVAPSAPEAPALPRRVLRVPLADAQPGESIVLGGGAMEYTYTVRSGDASRVQIDVVQSVEGQPLEGPPRSEVWSRNLWGIPAEGVVRRIQFERVRLGDRFYDAWKLFVFSQQAPRAYWISPDFAVHGLVQVARVTQGREELELAFQVRHDSQDGLGTSRPATVADESSDVLEPPLNDAEEGEVLVLAARDVQIEYRVTGARKLDLDVELRRRSSAGEAWGPARAETWSRNGFGVERLGTILSFQPESIDVDGVPTETWRMVVDEGSTRRAWWIAASVPVHGVVRVAPLGEDGEPDLGRAMARVPEGER